MQTFLVERQVGEASIATLLGLAAANQRQAAAMRTSGTGRIFYLGSTYLPEEGLCQCLFEASAKETVALHSAEASLPAQRIKLAIMMTLPPSASG